MIRTELSILPMIASPTVKYSPKSFQCPHIAFQHSQCPERPEIPGWLPPEGYKKEKLLES